MNQDSTGRNIRPADFQSPDQLKQRASRTSGKSASFPFLATGFVGLLLLVALATLIYLPDQVTRPQLEIDSANRADPAPDVLEQPFTDAQLLRARREAQEILAELIVAQNDLESLSVEEWAPDAYQEVLELAGSGDAAYQQRDFDLALSTYGGALQSALALLDQREVYAAEAVTRADRAFANGDSQAAAISYSLAFLLDPDNEAASSGIERAEVLDQVLELKDEATALSQDQDLDTAASRLATAVQLDPADADAASQLAAVREQIRQREFRELLASGFNALANTEYGEARTAFLAADKLIPHHPTVADAMLQVNSAAETRQRGALLDQAEIAERNEQWQQAVEYYQELRERDPANIEARVGLVRAQARADLEQKIDSILENPLSLQSDESWNEAERVLADARGIIDKTPNLNRQIAELGTVIQRARTPVELQLLSDGQTQIEIYRVGQLGSLREQRVNIYPGEYVVIGRRSGFRDVRREIEISGEDRNMTLRIEALEPIN